jgi:hypothetical protein
MYEKLTVKELIEKLRMEEPEPSNALLGEALARLLEGQQVIASLHV